jgi:hypothetical protein
VQAYEEKRQIPQKKNIIEHFALTTHNDSSQHWQGNHGLATNNVPARWKSAEIEINKREGEYVDVHCWQFNPNSFSDLIENLNQLGLITLKCIETIPTAKDNIEFFAVLEKLGNS